MISVLPCDYELIKKFYNKYNLPITEKSNCVVARFGEEILGECLFELDEKSITVLRLSPEEDILLADGILRSALHVAAQRSAMDAFYSSDAPVELFSKLGFIKDKNEMRLDIDKLFGGCNCKKEK